MGGTERNRALSVGKVDVQRACNERLDGVAMVAKGDLASGPELSVLVAVKKGAGRGTEKSRTVGGVVGEADGDGVGGATAGGCECQRLAPLAIAMLDPGWSSGPRSTVMPPPKAFPGFIK